MELIQKIGAILGYIATAMGLFAVIRSSILAKTKKYVEETAGTEESEHIHSELKNSITALEEKFAVYIDRDTEFKEKMENHLQTQHLVDRKLMANIIETLFYQNRDTETLDDNEFRRLVEVYQIYHDSPVNGNSYISELYKIMMTWRRV